jgi:drug/metabolite transporter (DMT)-like permease
MPIEWLSSQIWHPLGIDFNQREYLMLSWSSISAKTRLTEGSYPRMIAAVITIALARDVGLPERYTPHRIDVRRREYRDNVNAVVIDGISGAPIPPKLLSHLDHLHMASRLAPLWFFSNHSYALSLRYTSIASSTVLASMGSIFAFVFATCKRFGDERVTRWKVLGVALCFAGGGGDGMDGHRRIIASSSDGDGGWDFQRRTAGEDGEVTAPRPDP